MTLTALPGYSHLKILKPTAAPLGPDDPAPIEPAVRGIVLVALEAAFGMRNAATLPKGRFHLRVRNHIAATARSQRVRGAVRLLRIDAERLPIHSTRHDDPLGVRTLAKLEVHGAFSVGPRTKKAFAARLELPEGKRQWILQSLRIF